MRWAKDWVKRTPFALRLYRLLQWRVHVFKDFWGTRVWTRRHEARTPQGFMLASGMHPAYALMRAGNFEPAETELLSRELGHATLFVDVGANIGYYTLLARQRGVRVIAFEPQPQNLDALFRNLKLNDWEDGVEVFPLALSAAPGLLTLYGASGPSASLVKGWAGYSERHTRTVPVNTLDNVLGARLAGERLLIKIDVEGAEHDVLRGASAVLSSRPRPVWLVEICLGEFAPGSNAGFTQIFELFSSQGYEAQAVGRPGKAVTLDEIRAWAAAGESPHGFNYVFR